MKKASLINPLINRLEQDSSEEVQAASARALGKFAMLSEYKKLRARYLFKIQGTLLALISDKNKPIGIRCRALEAAAPLSLPQVKTAIMEAYQSPNPRLRLSAIDAMGKNSDSYWLPILLKELTSADIEARFEAAGACGEMEEKAAVPHLIKLTNDFDVDVQMAAIQALSKIGSTLAKRCLESCRDNISEAIRQAAEQALLELEMEANQLSFQP